MFTKLFKRTLFILFLSSILYADTIINITDIVITSKTVVGVMVNNAASWIGLTGANLVNNSCFEGPDDLGTGYSHYGWPWSKVGLGSATASIDVSTFTSGKQSQKIVVTSAPVIIQQYKSPLPQCA